MLVSWQLLQKFVQPPKAVSDKELMETLTMSTVEVENIINQAQRLDKVVVGLVVEVTAHPQADKLKLAKVDIGQRTLNIVCGGVNLREGMKVALAQPGAWVKWHGQGDWIQLTEAVIRGQTSQGMACAAEELDLPDETAVEHGIMDLSKLEAKPGTPLAQALAYDDVILDIENKSLTHRPDLWGHVGLARELSAIWQVPLHLPDLPQVKPGKDVSLKVSLKDKTKVHRYSAVVLDKIKVGPSPVWLKNALANLGYRSINNVVDVTNYVLVEMGQPLHAFDLQKLHSPEIVVRTAKSGEEIITLDGLTRQLDDTMLVIADKKKALAVAGIMGGANSEVDFGTTSILLESANFNAINVRQTAAKLNLRTEASARFEKALDPELVESAMRRAVQLLQEVISGARVASRIVDEYPTPWQIKPLELNLDWLWRRLGVTLRQTEVEGILTRLGFTVEDKGGYLLVTPPTWRATKDITIAEDLVEEVARIYGYDKIPLSLPKFDIKPPLKDAAQELRWKIKDLLVDLGWSETLSYSFMDNRVSAGAVGAKVELVNPVDANEACLRNELIHTFIPQVEQNIRRLPGQTIKMFEVGRVFNNPGITNNVLDVQAYHLALCLINFSGKDIRVTFEELKGVINEIFGLVGIKQQVIWRSTKPGSFKVFFNDQEIATGDFNKSGTTRVNCEIFLDNLPVGFVETEYKKIEIYPAIDRDLTLSIPNYLVSLNWSDIQELILTSDKLIEQVQYVDYYTPKNTLTLRLVLRSQDKTLTSADADVVVNKVIKLLREKFKAHIDN